MRAEDEATVGLAHRTDGTGHWMVFIEDRIVGCHCGYVTDQVDYNHGDDYLDHFESVVRAEAEAALAEARARIAKVEALAAEWYAERGAAAGHQVTDRDRGFAAASRLCADELRAALAAPAAPRDETDGGQ